LRIRTTDYGLGKQGGVTDTKNKVINLMAETSQVRQQRKTGRSHERGQTEKNLQAEGEKT
jgi:hypothetical protein